MFSNNTALSGEDFRKQLRVGRILFAVALAPLILQVGLFIYFFYPSRLGTGNANAQDTQYGDLSSESLPSSSLKSTEQGDTFASCIIGFADLHGDLSQARDVLELSGASNDTHLWAAGACTLVQTGDLVDRGPDSIAVTKLIEDVKQAAADAGGKVVTLLGNHELMNLQGDFRYLSEAELRHIGQSGLETNTLEELLSAVPARFRDSVSFYAKSDLLAGAAVWGHLMGPDSWLGQAIRSKPVATVQGAGACRTLFVHAGLLPATLEAVKDDTFVGFGKTPVARLNGAMAAALSTCDGAHACPKEGTPPAIVRGLGDSGPFWTRDYALGSEDQLCSKVESVLEEVGAQRVVVGHTVQEHVGSRCGGKVLLMDVGMTKWIRGKNLAAFKCVDGQIDIIDQ